MSEHPSEKDDDYAYVAAQAEANGYRRALDEARERIMRLPYEIDGGVWIDRDEVIGWIDELRGEK